MEFTGSEMMMLEWRETLGRKRRKSLLWEKNSLPLQRQEVIRVKGKDYNKEKKLQVIQVNGSTLRLFGSFAQLWMPFCVTCVCTDYFKKMKHADKSIADCSLSIKCCIDKDQSLLQAKHWMKMDGWKGHQENICVVKQSLWEIVYFTSKMCISRDLESYYIKWSLFLY